MVLRLAPFDGSEVICTTKKVSLDLSLGHNLLSTILLAKKRVEVLLWQVQVPSEISYLKELFGVVNIINNQYVFWTTDYFSNSNVDQWFINAVTSISIQIWHRWLCYLSDQNIFCLPNVADGIDVKSLIPDEIFADCMKKRQHKKPSYKLIL